MRAVGRAREPRRRRDLRRALAVALALATFAPAPLRADDPALRVSAPTALVPAAKRITDSYTTSYGRPVELGARGSRDGIAALRAGTVDVALSDIASGDETLKQTTIAYAPLALVADANVGVTSLRLDDVRRVLQGSIVSWRALGGRDIPIERFEPPPGSGADRIVTAALNLDARRKRGRIDDTSASIVADVTATPGGIGIVVLPFAGDLKGVRVLAIDGHTPDPDGARAGYPLLGAEFALTVGAPTLGVSRFIAYLRSSSDLWRTSGLIPVRDVPAR
jgi:phosphate transport system substrate-binding protein